MLRNIVLHPEKLRMKDKSGNLPLHQECSNQCRSAILSKCVELYPEALAVTDCKGYLPLHRLLSNNASSIEDELMMIEKYPAALQQTAGTSQNLPIHIEYKYRCRSSIILKCIELYPESLGDAGRERCLLLHRLLSNESSSIEDALMMMEKYPAALQHPSDEGELPLHIECRK
jgi:hypothetical protein